MEKLYGGCPLEEGLYDGRGYKTAIPESPNGRWVWRGEFFGAFDTVDKCLLKMGWHVLWYDCHDMFGAPAAIELMKKFHDFAVEKYSLDVKADINGFSRGGLYASNYALTYPDDIRTLYLDAPVLDFRQWPLGVHKECRDENEVPKLLTAYGFKDEDEAMAYTAQPVERIPELLSTGIPVLLIAGGADVNVPYMDNGARLAMEMVRTHHNAMIIVTANKGHHPHSVSPADTAAGFIAEN